MNVNKTVKWMTISVVVLVALIGGGGFILSYGALLSIGIGNGMPGDWRGYLWPLLTDAGLVVFTLALLTAQVTRQQVGLWVGGVIFLSLASMGYNVAHAPLEGKSVYGMALTIAVTIWPPLMLVLTTEALRHLLKTAIDRAGVVVTMTALGQQKEELERTRLTLEQQVADLTHRLTVQAQTKDAPRLSKAEQSLVTKERRERVLHLHREGLSQGKIARQLEVDISTVKRDIAALNKNGQLGQPEPVLVSQNGRAK